MSVDPTVAAWRAAMREARALDVGASDEDAAFDRELVLDARTGSARQAGAAPAQRGQLPSEVLRWRTGFERSLYAFVKGILGKRFLNAEFHREGCAFLQKSPPFRKLLMWPREFGKSAITADSIPIHALIQPGGLGANAWFPTQEFGGDDVRIVLACETLERGQDHLRMVRAEFESNKKLRALWPHRCWENPRKQAKKWNDNEIIIPRDQEWADPSVRVIGVGGAITGAHPVMLIKDDLISLNAANSPTVMSDAKRWHTVSRALINKPWAVEIVNGTHWAVGDLYSDIQRDPTVECRLRAAVEGGEPLWPDAFPLKRVEEIREEYVRAGSEGLFSLLYMNSTADSSLVDFNVSLLRGAEFDPEKRTIRVHEDERDAELREAVDPSARTPRTPNLRRKPLSALYAEGTPRDRYVRLKYG